MVLINSGAQVSTETDQYCKQEGLTFYPLESLLKIQATGGRLVPYRGDVEIDLRIPKCAGYNKLILLMVIPTSRYGQGIPVQIGTLTISKVMSAVA